MARNTLIAVGAVLILVGAVWFLQGVDVLGGSGMSGETLWSVVGPIVVLVGIGALVVGLRSRR